MKYYDSIHINQFGDGNKVKGMHSAKKPALLDNNYITIQTDIIKNGISFLL